MVIAKIAMVNCWLLVPVILFLAIVAGAEAEKSTYGAGEQGSQCRQVHRKRFKILLCIDVILLCGFALLELLFNSGAFLFVKISLLIFSSFVLFVIWSDFFWPSDTLLLPVLFNIIVACVCFALVYFGVRAENNKMKPYERAELQWSVQLVKLDSTELLDEELKNATFEDEYVVQINNDLYYFYTYDEATLKPGHISVDELEVVIDPVQVPKLEWYTEKTYYQCIRWGKLLEAEQPALGNTREFGRIYLPESNWQKYYKLTD